MRHYLWLAPPQDDHTALLQRENILAAENQKLKQDNSSKKKMFVVQEQECAKVREFLVPTSHTHKQL